MLPIQHYIFAIGAFQGLLLSLLLLFSVPASRANRILGLWCLVLAVSFLGRFVTVDEELNKFSVFIGWSYFLPSSYGALLYLYCRSALNEQKLQLKDLCHLGAVLACYLLNMDLLFASSESKLSFILDKPPQTLTFLLSELIMYAQAFVYLVVSALLLVRYRHLAFSSLSNFNPDIFSWLWKLLSLYCLIWVLKTVSGVMGGMPLVSGLGDGLIVVLIYSIALAQWRQPKLFNIEYLHTAHKRTANGEAQAVDSGAVTEQAAEPASNSDLSLELEPKSSGELTQDSKQRLLRLVEQHMARDRLYLESKLTLGRLAATVGVTTHQLSEVLNHREGENFYRFVNKYRVDYICRRFTEEPSLKVLDLAFEAGFSSKSTFNAVFKELKGQTPSQYRKEQSAS